MPQVNVQKLIETLEQSLMAQVAKRDGESYAQSFSRKFESDIDFRKQWRDLTDVKLGFADTATTTTAAAKGMTPTSTSVGSSLVADDSAEAVRLLGEMAERNGKSFEQVFADPANVKLAARTYTSSHRSSPSYDTELEKSFSPAGNVVDLTPPPTGRDPYWHSGRGA